VNFPGHFDSKLSYESPVSLDGEHFAFISKPGFVQHHAGSVTVIVPDAHLLFGGDYMRIGTDLVISGTHGKFVVGGYFKGDHRPTLSSPDGATLSGDIIGALTGHVHYAQATAASVAIVIGHVLKLSGSASCIRNGVTIELHIGDAVQKGDVIQTGSDSSVGLTLVDGSAFGMNANARMVLNELVYDPNGSSNSSLISLVQGTITFVAGQTAKNGNMRVDTPVATMGIRGTAVLVEIAADNGPTKFSVLVEPDGHTGSYNLYDKVSGQLIGTVSQAGQTTFVSTLGVGQPATAIEQLQTLADQQSAKALIQQVYQLYFPNYNPDDIKPNTNKNGMGSPGDNLNSLYAGLPLAPNLTPPSVIVTHTTGTDPVTGAIIVKDRTFYNTAAKFSAIAVGTDQGPANAQAGQTFSFKLGDKVVIDDPDIGNAPFYDIATPFVAGSAVIKSAALTSEAGAAPAVSATFLKSLIHIDQTTGEVNFDRTQFNFLDAGQSVTFMIQVQSKSGPETKPVVIPITITGANDAPTVVLSDSVVAKEVVEDSVAAACPLKADGVVIFQDVDLTDAHTASVAFTSSSVSAHLPGFTENDTQIGTFTIDPHVSENTSDTDNLGSVGWHFSVPDDDPMVQSLAAGQSITLVYTVTIGDGDAAVTQAITVTITGTNDAPVLAADTVQYHQTMEQVDVTGADPAVVDTVSGWLTFDDVDLIDTHQASASLSTEPDAIRWSGGDASDIPAATLAALATAMSASVVDSTDTGHGTLDWTFSLPDHLSDFLAHGETLTIVYDVTVTDDNGVSSTQPVTVQITAANDQPVITVVSDLTGAVTEDVCASSGVLNDSGTVAFSDADLTDTHTVHAAFSGAVASSGATVSDDLAAALQDALSVPSTALDAETHAFDWHFSLDNSLVQYLAAGETITVTYTITVQDNSAVAASDTSAPQTVTVVITGSNDEPTITVSNPAAVTEGDAGTAAPQTVTVADHVAITDIDASDAHVPYVADTLAFGHATGPAPAGGLGDLFTVNAADGTISYDKAAFDYLAAGEQVTATFTFDASSGPDTHHECITITIEGDNDAPVIATGAVAAATVADATTLSGVVLSDPDTSDTFTLTATADHGSVALSAASGSLSDLNTALAEGIVYTPDAAPPDVAPPATDKVALTVTDQAGATDTVNFIFSVSGTGPVTLEGTSQKDVFFASAQQDTFVFASGSGQDTITGFAAGTDKIDLQGLPSFDATALDHLLETADHVGTGGADLLLHLNGNTDTVLLKNVASLSAGDFILHA
jgi:VCBS repeat-containing protein